MAQRLVTDIIKTDSAKDPLRLSFFEDLQTPKETSEKCRPELVEGYIFQVDNCFSGVPRGTLLPTKRRVPHLIPLLGFGGIIIIALNFLLISRNGYELKGKVALATRSGFESIVQGGVALKEMNFQRALRFFEVARSEFQTVNQNLWFLQKNIKGMIIGAESLTQAGMIFTEAAKRLMVLPDWFLQKQEGPSAPSITESLKREIPNLEKVASLVKEASHSFKVTPLSLIPKQFHEMFMKAKAKLEALSNRFEETLQALPAILELLGDERPHRYLILFQNRHETRPTGGFIGSYGLATMNDGYLTEFEPHDTYHSDYLLKESFPPPEEFKPLLSRWFMRDCNYHVDFRVSGERCAWFLQKEAGPSVDSVVAIDQTVVEDLLRMTGPIFFEPLNQFITAENFSFIFSYITEAKITGRDNPKKLLKDFMMIFREELFKKADLRVIADVMRRAAVEKHLMVYSREPHIQAFLERAGMGGGIRGASGVGDDFLHIVNYSIGGNKSDEFVKQRMLHETFFMPDGSIENSLTIEKTHTWNSQVLERQKNLLRSFGFPENFSEDEGSAKKLRWILGQGNNFSAMRIYVPSGSELISWEGDFEVLLKEDPEFTDYFSTKMDVRAGGTETLRIRYRLPWKFESRPLAEYRFSFEKQSGLTDIELEKRIFARPGYRLLRRFPEPHVESKDGDLVYQTTVKGNSHVATLWRKF